MPLSKTAGALDLNSLIGFNPMLKRLNKSIRQHILAIMLLLSFLSGNGAHAQRPTEYEVKAAFIYNFAKFVEWQKPADEALPLCIIGDDPFGSAIKNVEGKTVAGKRIAVRRIKSLEELKGCQMLFISSSEKRKLGEITGLAKDIGILTISDTENFAEKGVVINLYMEEDNVRFEINIDAASDARLKINSRLLSLARIVHYKSRQ